MTDEINTASLLKSVARKHDVGQYAERVRGLVTPERFSHIVRVTALALKFAEANGFSDEQTRQVAEAAILHDAARDMSKAELTELVEPRLDLERRHTLALHGRAGRSLAASWGVTDEAVLNAVEGHVFGVPPGDLVGMAVYVADVSEEGRGVNQQIRELALNDLSAAYELAVRAKVHYLRRCGKEIHPETLKTYESITGESINYAAEPDPGGAEA